MDEKWEKKGEKDLYPSLYLLTKVSEGIYESLGVPKQVMCKNYFVIYLDPPVVNQFKPLVLPKYDKNQLWDGKLIA